MTADDLPIQPTVRPEPASVRKAVSAPDKNDAPSFADVLDAETETKTDDAAPAAAAPAQPAPQPTNTAASFVAALQTLSAEPGAETADAGTSGDAVAATIAIPDATAIVAQPAVQAAPVAIELIAAAPIVAAAIAPAIVPIVAAKPGKAAGVEAKSAETAKGGDAADGKANADPSPEAGTATPAVAGAVTSAALQATTPVAVEASLSIPAAAKATSPQTAPDAALPAADASSSSTSTSAPDAKAIQPASSGASPAQAASAQANAQAAAADASAPDIKVDAAATSTSTSTSIADALTAQAPASDTGVAKTSPALASAPAAVAQVYTRFIERHDGRAQRFEVRLDPVELGRVDVRIEIGADKKVHAVLAAHDSAALTDLMKGQRALERALGDAGIDLADGGLSFEMSRDTGRGLAGNESQGDRWSNQQDANVWRGFSALDIPVETNAADLSAATRIYRRAAARLDVVA